MNQLTAEHNMLALNGLTASGTVTLAKLTTGGANGSITYSFQNGIVLTFTVVEPT